MISYTLIWLATHVIGRSSDPYCCKEWSREFFGPKVYFPILPPAGKSAFPFFRPDTLQLEESPHRLATACMRCSWSDTAGHSAGKQCERRQRPTGLADLAVERPFVCTLHREAAQRLSTEQILVCRRKLVQGSYKHTLPVTEAEADHLVSHITWITPARNASGRPVIYCKCGERLWTCDTYRSLVEQLLSHKVRASCKYLAITAQPEPHSPAQ